MRHKSLTTRMTAILAVSVLVLILPACNPLENETTAMSLLQIVSLMGLDSTGAAADYIQSDILFEDPDTGETAIFADIATATLTAQMLDPDPINGISPYADIQLTGYTVTYSRSDGKNTPGVDVPYPFDGSLTSLIAVGSQSSVSFVIVRETAKQESPLLDILQDSSRPEGLTVTARVDFYGHDLTNENVTATGYISITFANYGN
ncbi:MAG: hypothetical protein ACYDH3_12545 [Candidatus Aminicenantales bacterium]